MSTKSVTTLVFAALVLIATAIGPTRLGADERDDLILQLQDQNQLLNDRLNDQEKRLAAVEGSPALATAALASVGAADTDAPIGKHSVYGDLRYSLNRIETDTGSSSMETTSGESNASRFGLKGSWGGEEWKALYHIEFGVNPETSMTGDVVTRRYAYGGIKSARFGTLKYGTMTTPYKMPGYLMDPFYDTSAGTGIAGANFGLSPQTNGWINDSITYTSPSFAGFTLSGGTYLDDSDEDDHGVTGGIEYKGGGFTGGVHFMDATNETSMATSDRELVRVYGSYTFVERLTLAGSWEKAWIDGATDVNYYYGVGRFAVNPRLQLVTTIGYEDAGLREGVGLTFGAFYKVLHQTSLYGLISNVNRNDESASNPARLAFATGITHKFGFGN